MADGGKPVYFAEVATTALFVRRDASMHGRSRKHKLRSFLLKKKKKKREIIFARIFGVSRFLYNFLRVKFRCAIDIEFYCFVKNL